MWGGGGLVCAPNPWQYNQFVVSNNYLAEEAVTLKNNN